MLGELRPNQYGTTRALYHLSDTTDSSGNGYTLTNNGTVTFTAGKFGNCADLGTSNSTKSLTILSNNLGISGSSDFTISGWVKIRTEIGAGAYDLFNLNTGTSAGNNFYILGYEYNSGTRRLYAYFGVNQIVYNITLGTTNWYHMAFKRASTVTSIFLNGNQVVTGTNNTTNPGSYGFGIGAQHDQSNESSAMFDEVHVASTALTANQIRQMYAIGVGKYY